jgi:CrcB protein
MAITLLAISLGAALGAMLRYGLSIALNAFLPSLPPGTLAANWIAAYVVGFGIAWFAANPSVPVPWRLFVITGLAGGLSTFSTFSAELLFILREGRFGWSAGMLVLHVAGSLSMTVLGMATQTWMRAR